MNEEIIYGRNAVTEALKSDMPVNKVIIAPLNIIFHCVQYKKCRFPERKRHLI